MEVSVAALEILDHLMVFAQIFGGILIVGWLAQPFVARSRRRNTEEGQE